MFCGMGSQVPKEGVVQVGCQNREEKHAPWQYVAGISHRQRTVQGVLRMYHERARVRLDGPACSSLVRPAPAADAGALGGQGLLLLLPHRHLFLGRRRASGGGLLAPVAQAAGR